MTKSPYERRRRAMEQGRSGDTVPITPNEWRELLRRTGRRCLKCGKRFGIECVGSRDHIVPLALGGGADVGNVQPLCTACNNAKGGEDTTDYRPHAVREWAQALVRPIVRVWSKGGNR